MTIHVEKGELQALLSIGFTGSSLNSFEYLLLVSLLVDPY
jgi:hypothetical protein